MNKYFLAKVRLNIPKGAKKKTKAREQIQDQQE